MSSGFNIRGIQIVISSSQNAFTISEPVVAFIPLPYENIDVVSEEHSLYIGDGALSKM